MNTRINTLMISFGIACAFLMMACTKPAGPGGKAVVTGKVYARDYDNTQQYLISKGYAEGETVYIVYGNGSDIGDDVKTSYDGSFKFLYLNKGHYKVFVNSLDTNIRVKGNDTKYPVIKEFDITSPKQTIDLGDIVINK
jgi:hypothetical protein